MRTSSRTWLGAVIVAALATTGCTATAAGSAPSGPSGTTHVMPDGTVMDGTEHGAHKQGPGGAHGSGYGPSDAAQMVCAGQVVHAVAGILELPNEVTPSSEWAEPMFTCRFDIDGDALVLSVHDANANDDGEAHFAELREGTSGAERIEGLLGLGLPSFSTGDGMVGFLRDGKTLLVDATGLPEELGESGSKSRHDVAYAVASAVLVCWVEHS